MRRPGNGRAAPRILGRSLPFAGAPRHEANLPTQEAQARANARFPGPDADAGWSADAQAPPGQGPQALDGVSAPVAGARSPKRGRLSRSADFDRVMRNGRSHAGRDLVLYVFPRGSESDDGQARLGLSVSRKVGGAVDRNRVKRLLREAFQREADRLPAGSDVVVIARPGAGTLAEREGLGGIHAALAELVSKVAGISSQTESE